MKFRVRVRLVAFVVSFVAAATARAAGPKDAPPVGAGGGVTLFGDLHAHTTLSVDAKFVATSALSGWGFAEPMLACEFARHCSSLDFWSINDHAEGLLPSDWVTTKEAIRACNAAYGGDGPDPELVSFLGFEWSQSSLDRTQHFSHKNVVFLDTADAEVPARPIRYTDGITAAQGLFGPVDPFDPPDLGLASGAVSDPAAAAKTVGDLPVSNPLEDLQLLLNLISTVAGVSTVPLCDTSLAPQALPENCQEIAPTPAALHDRLGLWGFDYITIPHATAWGFHAPFLPNWKTQLGNENFRPDRELMVEIYSGHGNSEEYRSWRGAVEGPGGALSCPAPTADYEPCCWRARRIALDHAPECLADPGSAACAAAQDLAEQTFLTFSFRGVEAVDNLYWPGSFVLPEEWSDCGSCRDCAFNADMDLRPTGSVQAGLATTAFGPSGGTANLRFGIIGSSDEHDGRPGIGMKDLKKLSDLPGYLAEGAAEAAEMNKPSFQNAFARMSSFWFASGLVAVHAEDRSRGAIWNALKSKRVFGTSGPRILLWFDAVPAGSMTPVPMGSALATDTAPTFRAKAVGDFKQDPGCPAAKVAELGEAFIDDVCLGECYNPTAERYLIDRIEVVRIRPQTSEGEPLDGLIDDPWMTISCAPDPAGCEVAFTDPDYAASGRPAVYYVRAIQEEQPILNGAGLRCEGYDGTECTAVNRCEGGFNGIGDDCLAPGNHRAWSSPIFLDRPGACVDNDGDGFNVGAACGVPDCNDLDPAANPDGAEDCANGTDDDCDGAIDGADTDCGCMDADGDGYGTGYTALCPNPGVDCDDGNASVHPGAAELPGNGVDENCNGDDLCGSIPVAGGGGASALAAFALAGAAFAWAARRRRAPRS